MNSENESQQPDDRILFCAQDGGFYPLAYKEIYEASGTWPKLGVVLTADQHKALLYRQCQGECISSDAEGRPITTPPPAMTDEEIINRNMATRDGLIKSARETMTEWQNDLLLGTISEEDRASLIKWNNYVKELKALDLSVLDIIFPTPPEMTN